MLMFLTGQAYAQREVQILRFDQIEARLRDPNETRFLVVNFWATWCKPCVKELPYFEKLRAEYAPQGVDVLLLSVDFPEDFEKRVRSFVKERGLESEVICINESNANSFIDRIDPSWSGAIPATLLVAPGGRYVAFHAGEFTYESLVEFVKPHLTTK
jgi:thiol-disulfide isomerase/thioredoxin